MEIQTVNLIYDKRIVLHPSSFVGGNILSQSQTELVNKKMLELFYDTISKINNPTVLDVGAHIGTVSLLAKFINNSIFFAFEPSDVFKTLEQNIYLNNLDNVFCCNIAIADFVGQAGFKFVPDSTMLSTFGNIRPGHTYDTKTVNVFTLDYIFDKLNFRKVDLIKVDVQGSEMRVLVGAKNLLLKFHPKILFEYESGAEYSIKSINSFLTSVGYKDIHNITPTDYEAI